MSLWSDPEYYENCGGSLNDKVNEKDQCKRRLERIETEYKLIMIGLVVISFFIVLSAAAVTALTITVR